MGRVIKELQKWVSGNSLLIVTVAGILTRIYCPFKVRALCPLENFKMGQEYVVERVGVSKNLDLVYIIQGKAYAYHFFAIVKN